MPVWITECIHSRISAYITYWQYVPCSIASWHQISDRNVISSHFLKCSIFLVQACHWKFKIPWSRKKSQEWAFGIAWYRVLVICIIIDNFRLIAEILRVIAAISPIISRIIMSWTKLQVNSWNPWRVRMVRSTNLHNLVECNISR